MGTTNLYYLNGVDLPSSTAVYTDVLLTTLAPDGWYSFGGVVREQLLGVLQPVVQCPSCAYPCSAVPITNPPFSGSNELFQMPISAGGGIGSVRIDMEIILTSIFGFRVEYGLNTFNYAVGATVGHVQAPYPRTTWVSDGSCAALPIPTPFILTDYILNNLGSYVPTGNTSSAVVLPTDVITVAAPVLEKYTTFIPKNSVSETDLTLYLYAYSGCSPNTINVTAYCPDLLPSEPIHTTPFPDSATACGYDGDEYSTIYVGRINGIAGTIGLYDMLFMDSVSQTPFIYPAGWYVHKSGGVTTAIEVDSNGVVINTVTCP